MTLCRAGCRSGGCCSRSLLICYHLLPFQTMRSGSCIPLSLSDQVFKQSRLFGCAANQALMAVLPSLCKLSRLLSVCWACANIGRPWGAQSAIKEAANEASDLTSVMQYSILLMGSEAMASLFLLKAGAS